MNVSKFKNQKSLNTYNLNIGNYYFKIKSSQKLDLSNYNNISKNDNLPQITINFWIEDNEELRNEFLNECKNMVKIIPYDLNIFFEELNKKVNKHYEIKNKYNSFYTNGKENYYCFEYVTDNFFLYYKEDQNEIFIIGNENNLERIIIDFLTVCTCILPLHAVAMQSPNGKGIGITGESGSGKTSLMIKLLEQDFLFLTDDALFIDKNKNLIRVNNSFSFKKNYSNNTKLEEYGKKVNKEKIIINFNIAKLLINLKLTGKIEKYTFFKLNDVEKIENLKEPFPCISKNSFWCLPFLIKKNKREYISNLIEKSIYEWNRILKNSKYIEIDFQNLDKFTLQFSKSIQEQ